MASAKSYAQAFLEATASLEVSEQIAWLMVLADRRIQRILIRVLQESNPTTALGALGVPDPIAQFLRVVAEDRAMSKLTAMTQQGLSEVVRRQIGTPVRLKTARPLAESVLAQVVTTIASSQAAPVVLDTTVDPSLLGGFRAEIGQQWIDQSFASRLAALKTQLQQA